MSLKSLVLATALTVSITMASLAQTGGSDDFNRAAGSNMGPRWSEVAGWGLS